MNSITDEYTSQVFDFLEKMPFYKIYTVDKICKSETREKFIAAVKLYISTWTYGGGVSFLTETYERFRKIEIPEAALKALNQ